MSDRPSYSVSTTPSPPMPSYEPRSASTSSSSRPTHMPVKKESWRPGQSTSTPVNAPTGPAASTWKEMAGPSEEYRPPSAAGHGREGSRSPLSRRDGSPTSSRGYDRERDFGDWDRRRDRYDKGRDTSNRLGPTGTGTGTGRNGQSDRSWAAWNKKVETSGRKDDERDRRRERDSDRRRDRDRDYHRDRDVDRGGQKDRRRSPNKTGKERDDGDGRSWAAWKAKVEDTSTRRDREEDRRRSGGVNGTDSRRLDEPTSNDSGRRGRERSVTPPRNRDRSPVSSAGRARRDSPDYGLGQHRGRRDSPDYGVGGRAEQRLRRPDSPLANDRKRPPASPPSQNSKRPRDQSPSPPYSRRDSPSPPPANRWGRRAHPLSPERNRSPPSGPRVRNPPAAAAAPGPAAGPGPGPTPKRQSLAPQSHLFMSGSAPPPGPRRWGPRDEHNAPPPVDRWGREERMDTDTTLSRVGAAYRPPAPESPTLPYQNGHPSQPVMPPFPPSQPPAFAQVAKPPPPPSTALPYDSPPQPASKSLAPTTPANGTNAVSATGPVKIAFTSVSPKKSGWRSISPTKPAIQRMFTESSPPSRNPTPAHQQVRPPSPTKEVTSHHPNVYLDRIAASERQYSAHLSSIAPYVQAAFNQWFAQGTSPPLQAFLVHYFGREPTDNELSQIERLLRLRQKTSQDQEEWRGLHDKAVAGNGHGRQPRSNDTDSSRGVNAIPIPTSRWTPSVSSAPLPQSGPNAMPTPTSLPPTQPKAAHTHQVTSAVQAPPQLAPRGEHDHQSPPVPASVPAPSPRPAVDVVPASPRGPFNASGEMYEKLSHVGQGTYGKVYKARSNDDGSMVALKRIRMEGEKDGFPVTAMREIKLLQGLRHRNVVRLHEIMVSKGSVHMVFEYMDHDLTGLLAHSDLTFSPGHIKSLSHQMLCGLAYLHDRSILHRDMKGSNILLNASGELKLADFGLARLYSKRHRDDYTNRVITLWYRSPELLMGETVYGPEVDMWSAGCIMLEIFTTKPIFQGNDEIHQLEVIYGIMGTPDEEDWPGVKDLPWYELVKPKETLPSKFRSSFAKWLSPAALDLVEGLLHFDPSRRLSAKGAMVTPYFAQEEPPMEIPTQLAGMGEHHEMSAKQERQRRRVESGR